MELVLEEMMDSGLQAYCREGNTDEIKSYCDLRSSQFMQTYGDPDVGADEYDVPGNVIIASDGARVTGGIRLSVAQADTGIKLPMERYQIDLPSLMPHLHGRRYAEISRLCVAQEWKGRGLAKQLVRLALEKTRQHACHHLFGIVPRELTGYYTRFFAELGYNICFTRHQRVLQFSSRSVALNIAEISPLW